MWVLPVMTYNIIISTDWMQKHDFYIKVNDQICDMENIKKNLIQKCSIINTYEVEELMKKDKIMKMIV
jgi:hypothetical protein